MIGGSTPMQHWKRGTDETNAVKVALRKGDVDVLSLASNATMPEEGIDNFAYLGFAHNPNIRIMTQMTWGTFDGLGMNMKPQDRDLSTLEDIATMRMWVEPYEERMREQMRAINQRHSKTIAYIVPVHEAVMSLRREVLLGRIPGLTKQTELFADTLGHPKKPLVDFVSYVWFAAMYRKSPVGLTALDQENSETSKAQHRAMQQLAWEAVIQEPMSGVILPPKALPPRT